MGMAIARLHINLKAYDAVALSRDETWVCKANRGPKEESPVTILARVVEREPRWMNKPKSRSIREIRIQIYST